MFHSPPRRRLVVAILALLFVALASTFVLRSPSVASAIQTAPNGYPVTAAWEKAKASGSYHFTSDVTQITIPSAKMTNVGRSSRSEQLHLEGENDLHQNAMELRLWSNGGNVQQTEDSVGVKISQGKTFVRRGTSEWQERTDFSLDTVAPQGDFMSYLVAMRNVQANPSESRNGIRFTRYTFTIDGPTFALHLHKQMEAAMRAKGELPADMNLEVPRYYQEMTGNGELWIGEDGLPLRQVMNLQFPEQKDEQVNAQIVVDFSKFGKPVVAPLALLRAGDWRGVLASIGAATASVSTGMLPLLLLSGLLLGVLLIVRYRRARVLQHAMAIAVIGSMVIGPLLNTLITVRFLDVQSAKAAARDEQQANVDQEQSVRDALGKVEFNPHINPLESSDSRLGDIRESQSNDWEIAHQSPNLSISQSPVASSLAVIPVDSSLDTDKDGLSDFVEERVGTSLVISDTDSDGLTDNLEVRGFSFGGKQWYLNPDAADSNGDGQGDLLEWGMNANGAPLATPQDTDGDGTPDLFDIDNDNDGVPDSKDLSPYRLMKDGTGVPANFNETTPFKLTVNNLAANTPVLVDFQIRPKDAKHLWFAYNVLDWPNDAEGQMRDIDGVTYADVGGVTGNNGANGDLKLTPVLEIRISGATTNLPSPAILNAYNLTLNNYTADGSTKLVYVPLSIINDESTGQRVAFNGRMRYNAAGSWPSPHDVRLAWVVQGLVDLPCDPADAQDVAQGCQPDGYIHNVQQVLNSYYDDFSLTGISVREDRGASQAIIYEDPAVDSDKLDDFPLWALSDGLNERFLGGVIDLNEVLRRFNRTTNGAVSNTERWSIPNTLRVEKKDYPSFDEAVVTTAMTETKRILNSQFTSSWQTDNNLKPLMLFASEQRFRAQGLDSIASPSGNALTLDFSPSGQAIEVQTLANFKATPYCAAAGSAPTWDVCDVNTYWAELEQRHLNAAALPSDSDPDLKLGRMFATEIYFLSLLNGASTVTKVGTRSVSALYSLKTDTQLETDYRTYLSLGLRTGIPAIANQIVMARLTGGDTTAAKLLSSGWKSLQRIGLGIPSAKGEFSKFGQAIKKVFQSVTLKKVGIALVVTVAVTGLVTGLLVGLPENGLGKQILAKILAIGVTTALSVVMPILDVVEVVGLLSAGGATGAATKILGMSSELIGSSRTAGAIGAVLAIGLTWGFFIYSMVSNQVSAFSAEFNKALAEAIAATIYILVLTLVSSTVIGTIIVAILAVIDAILTAVCELGVDELRTVPGLGGACFTLGNGAIKVLGYLIYNYDQMVDTDRKDLVVMGGPKIALADPNKGFIQGNGISVSMPVTTTAVHKSPDPSNGLIINVYLYLFSPNNLRSTTFKYSLSQSEQALSVERDQMTSAWQNVGVDHYYGATPMYRGQAAANPVPQVTGIVRTAGLNRTVDFFFNTGYALPAYECWMMPFPFIPFVPPIPVCYTRTLAGSNSTKIDAMKFDIFPATLDGFMTLGAKPDGGLGMSWDPAFLSLKDADGDGLLAINRGGIDPNDNSWDTDNDGLSDSYELERRQAGVNFSLTARDTDGDGLTDLQEAQFDTNPAKADTDGDGLKDSEEVWHERIDATTGAATGIWEGGWNVTINATAPFVVRVSSDPTLKDTDNDGLDDLAERVLALDPVAANRIDLDNRPYSPIIVNSPPIVVSGESNDLDRFLAPNQSLLYTSTVVALRPMNPGTLNLTVPGVLGVPSPASPYALGFNPLTFNTAQTLTVQTNLKVIANPTSQVANIGSRVQATLNPSNGSVSATGAYTVTVDNDKPIVALTSLPNGGYVRAFNRTFYVIGGTATDPTSYPTLVRVTAQDGIGTRDANGTTSWTASVGINPGTNIISLYARDAVGNETTTLTSYTIYGDGLAPGGQILSPDGNYTTTRNSAGQWVVKINGTVNDPNINLNGTPYPASGVDPASLRMLLDPFDFNPGQSLEVGSWQPVVYNASNGTWSIDYVLPSDVTDLPPSAFYGARLSASDKVGNTTVGASLRIRVDARPPVATLTATDVARNLLSATITNPVSIGGTLLDPLIGTNIDDINFQPNDKLDISFAPITSVLPYSGTVLQLNFEERTGSATFVDSSGQANNAYCSGRCPQAGVAGRGGNGLQSATNSASLYVKDNPGLSFPQFPATGNALSFSTQGWIKLGAETSNGMIILEKLGNRGGYSLGIADGQGRAYWKVTRSTFTADAVTITGNRDLRDGQWHHLAGVYDRQQMLSSFYVDGVLVGSATAANADYGSPFDRSNMNVAYSSFGRAATVDQVAVWNRALTAAEVQALYRTADKVWVPATVVPRTVVGNPATWSLAVPNNLEGMIQIDGRATDIFGNRGANNNLWRGIIDNVAPRHHQRHGDRSIRAGCQQRAPIRSEVQLCGE
ncbi:MAG: LamG-like jellyroll fold domain-containing protein [Caldilineaceae bacterium]